MHEQTGSLSSVNNFFPSTDPSPVAKLNLLEGGGGGGKKEKQENRQEIPSVAKEIVENRFEKTCLLMKLDP